MIDFALIKHVWRDIRHREIRILIVAVLIASKIVPTCGELSSYPQGYAGILRDLFPASVSYSIFWVCVLGAGIVGIKVSRGTLALILSRPVTTTSFILSSWLAIAIAAIVVQTLLFALQAAQVLLFMPSVFDTGSFVCSFLKSICLCFSASAVLVYFSTLLSGVKDAGLFFLAVLVANLLGAASTIPAREIKDAFWRHLVQTLATIGERLGDVAQACINPSIPFSSSVPFSWNLALSLVALVAVILAALSLAIQRMNNMEISYGAD